MASKPAKRSRLGSRTTLLTPVTTPRAGSEELGDMDLPAPAPKVNPKTGRPIRASAGRKSLDPGYLNTTEVVDVISDEEQDEDAWDDEEIISSRRKAKPKLTLKRKRSEPSPPPPVLSPAPSDFGDASGFDLDPETAVEATSNASKLMIPPIHLTINIPKGFEGPLQIQLDPSMLAQSKQLGLSYVRPGFIPYSNSVKNKKGFLDLPAELRNQVYRHVLVKNVEVNFAHPAAFSRTAALLRTCRQVYEEARDILYSENEFRFDREQRSIRRTFSAHSDEVGYKQFLRILKTIGAHNIAKFRKLSIEFEDQMPRHAGIGMSREEMRYVHDNYLIEGLKMIGQHAQLYKLNLVFNGRYVLRKIDLRFLRHLCELKADELEFEGYRDHGYYPSRKWPDDYPLSRIMGDMREEIKSKIVRSEKMFPELAAQEAAAKEKEEAARKKREEAAKK